MAASKVCHLMTASLQLRHEVEDMNITAAIPAPGQLGIVSVFGNPQKFPCRILTVVMLRVSNLSSDAMVIVAICADERTDRGIDPIF